MLPGVFLIEDQANILPNLLIKFKNNHISCLIINPINDEFSD